MKIVLLTVGKLKQEELQRLEKTYSQRISKYIEFEIREVRAENYKASEKDLAIASEGDRLLRSIPVDAIVWILDLKGREITSEQFAAMILKVREQGTGELVLIVGGTFGLAEQVVRRGQLRVSFSKLTFPHELFRVVLLEQIFRAFKIMKNEPYHY